MTPGQEQARRELERIAQVPQSPVRIQDTSEELIEEGLLQIRLEIDCSDTPVLPSGIRLKPAEIFIVCVFADFPFTSPRVLTPDPRFAGRPHVLWAHEICLYTSPNEWDPSAGMWGFVDRLLTWLARAAEGSLSAAVLPWHPPVARDSAAFGPLIVRAEVPEWARDARLWHAWLLVRRVDERILEAVGWMQDPREIRRRPDRFAVPVIALDRPAGFTYPNDGSALVDALVAHGFTKQRLARLLTATRLANAVNPDAPLILAVGSPAPGGVDAPQRIAHLVAWWISADPREAEPGWIKVFDLRPSASVRRDSSRPAGWIAGKTILVLGCGALGAPIAEHCARAGAASLTLVDSGRVTPGILVRQPYEFADVGLPKARVLAERLRRVAPGTALTPVCGDALDQVQHPEVDLIVDATANRSVAARLERERWRGEQRRPPLLSMMVGHNSDLGIATLSLPGASGAGVDLLRRLTVAASEDDSLTIVLDDLYPDPPRTRIFQPEPGCSDPTFIGSSTDLAAIAATLFNGALSVLGSTSADPPPGQLRPTRFGLVTAVPTGLRPAGLNRRLAWTDDVIRRDDRNDYEIRVDPAVFARVRQAAIAAAAADSTGGTETGGALLGQVDLASRVAWVTRAEGLPPESSASADRLEFDVTRLRDRFADHRRHTRGTVSLIGMWHTHPHSRADASSRDEATMRGIVDGFPGLAQALLLIFGGGPDAWRAWLDGAKLPDLYVRMFFPGEAEPRG
ncbi:hypothetical protein Val02_48270 [Virgisporangium aliadipatigenens]|uniref:Uncharacterized protein n=1 Tax=Virgisporangium aliadipatigenens TaxID=741659 RepID=A0A8J3YMG8_9ACTN|nr:ThiF family adenylyltransferase [Virgisporangium aliadipatigenens]GIJ47941.1 hypothetical protein Val02_48270 [Virgisporangium aliadipatigenens]